MRSFFLIFSMAQFTQYCVYILLCVSKHILLSLRRFLCVYIFLCFYIFVLPSQLIPPGFHAIRLVFLFTCVAFLGLAFGFNKRRHLIADASPLPLPKRCFLSFLSFFSFLPSITSRRIVELGGYALLRIHPSLLTSSFFVPFFGMW